MRKQRIFIAFMLVFFSLPVLAADVRIEIRGEIDDATLPAGPQGPQGAVGPQGPTGPPGTSTGFDGAKVVTATADLAAARDVLDAADIRAAIAACGTERCRVGLVAGTYANTCLAIHNIHSKGLTITGQGKGVTFLAPPTDLDDCKGITTGGAFITINTSENIELSHFTIDGNKNALREVPTCAATSGALGGCGLAIWVVSEAGEPGSSTNISIHDLEIRELINSAIVSRNGKDIFIFNNDLRELGCRQSDTPCGCVGGMAACNDWTAMPDVAGIPGFKTKGLGVSIENGTKNAKVINNNVTLTTYPGIEVMQTYLGGGNTVVEDNEVVGTSIVVNGGVEVTLRRNTIKGASVPGGVGEAGAGISVAANVTRNVTIEDNIITGCDSSGLIVKGASGSNAIVRGNVLSGNCVHHAAGAGVGDLIVRSSGATPFRDVLLESNTVTSGAHCSYSMTVDDDGGLSETEGATRIIGGSFDKNVRLGNKGMFVQGMSVKGNLVYTTNASGIALNNSAAGATTYAPGSAMIVLDQGAWVPGT